MTRPVWALSVVLLVELERESDEHDWGPTVSGVKFFIPTLSTTSANALKGNPISQHWDMFPAKW